MIDARKRFAAAMQKPDEAAVKKITEHFEAQGDLHTQCPRCHAQLRGTKEQLMSHDCLEGLIGVA